jgi:peptide/nickel transport system permease protein
MATAAPAARALARHVAAAILTLLVVSVVVFVLSDKLPKDQAFAALGHESTPEQRLAFRTRMHLDDPPQVRYGRWLAGMLHGDFGTSTISARPVAPDVLTRLGHTSVLAVSALLLSAGLALPLAVFAARRAGSTGDVVLSVGAVAVTAMPEYVIAVCLLLVLGAQLHVFPVVSIGVADGDVLSYGLPVLTLGLVGAAYMYRFARVSVIETMAAPYVRAAVLRGYSPRRVLWRHVMPNAGAAVVNVVAINVIYLFGGVIVVENVFSYPGLGTALVAAIYAKDFPVIEAVALLMSALIVGVNLLADAAVLALNPRLRAARG